jgi:hypothetical protein
MTKLNAAEVKLITNKVLPTIIIFLLVHILMLRSRASWQSTKTPSPSLLYPSLLPELLPRETTKSTLTGQALCQQAQLSPLLLVRIAQLPSLASLRFPGSKIWITHGQSS